MSEDDRVQYKFMIPSALKKRIEDAAHASKRSLSAEILETLKQKYPAEEESAFIKFLEAGTRIRDLSSLLAEAGLSDMRRNELREQLSQAHSDLDRYAEASKIAFWTDGYAPNS